jgi:hypothetical protein
MVGRALAAADMHAGGQVIELLAVVSRDTSGLRKKSTARLVGDVLKSVGYRTAERFLRLTIDSLECERQCRFFGARVPTRGQAHRSVDVSEVMWTLASEMTAVVTADLAVS